jgi:hypothetical protein
MACGMTKVGDEGLCDVKCAEDVGVETAEVFFGTGCGCQRCGSKAAKYLRCLFHGAYEHVSGDID